MAVEVELDIFSGRPNPSWWLSRKDAATLLEAYLTSRLLAIAPESAPTRLGYRGFIVTLTGSHAAAAAGRRLEFRIVGSEAFGESAELRTLLAGIAVRDGHVVSETVADEMDTADVAGMETDAGLLPVEVDPAGISPLASCARYLWPTPKSNNDEFRFWNQSPHLEYNNCYNFCSHFRSGTFAQPGRRSGRQFTSMTVANIKAQPDEMGIQPVVQEPTSRLPWRCGPRLTTTGIE